MYTLHRRECCCDLCRTDGLDAVRCIRIIGTHLQSAAPRDYMGTTKTPKLIPLVAHATDGSIEVLLWVLPTASAAFNLQDARSPALTRQGIVTGKAAVTYWSQTKLGETVLLFSICTSYLAINEYFRPAQVCSMWHLRDRVSRGLYVSIHHAKSSARGQRYNSHEGSWSDRQEQV